MSIETGKACLYPAIGAMVALALCPAAQAQPERQCYLTTAGEAVCVILSNSDSTSRDCYLVPMGPRCFIPTTLPERSGRVQLPNGEWASPLPEEQWPPPGREIEWPDTPPEGEQPAGTSEEQQPRGARPILDWDFISAR
jgi:hypothetical protein